MAKVTGLGGVFFKTKDRAATAKWFDEKLGLPTESWGRVFPWRHHDEPEQTGFTVLGLHAEDSDYFDPSHKHFMLNLTVDDLDGVLATLRDQGVEIVKVFDADDNGRFAHVMGPDGIKIELWEPKPDDARAP